MNRSRWLVTVRIAANVVVFAALATVVYRDRSSFARALDMGFRDFSLIAAFSIATWLVTSVLQVEMLRVLSARISYGWMMALQMGTGLLNYLPARVGTFYRAQFLKRQAGLSYTHFGSLSLVYVLVMLAAAGVTGVVATSVSYGLSGAPQQRLLVAFLLLAAAGGAPLLPLPRAGGTKRWSVHWNRFVVGRNVLIANPMLMLAMFGCHVLLFVFGAIRFSAGFHALGVPIGLSECLILGAIGRLSLVLGLTPGALGVQEFAVAACAYLLGVPFSTSVLAGTVVRAVTIVCYIACGIPALIALRKNERRVGPPETLSGS